MRSESDFPLPPRPVSIKLGYYLMFRDYRSQQIWLFVTLLLVLQTSLFLPVCSGQYFLRHPHLSTLGTLVNLSVKSKDSADPRSVVSEVHYQVQGHNLAILFSWQEPASSPLHQPGEEVRVIYASAHPEIAYVEGSEPTQAVFDHFLLRIFAWLSCFFLALQGIFVWQGSKKIRLVKYGSAVQGQVRTSRRIRKNNNVFPEFVNYEIAYSVRNKSCLLRCVLDSRQPEAIPGDRVILLYDQRQAERALPVLGLPDFLQLNPQTRRIQPPTQTASSKLFWAMALYLPGLVAGAWVFVHLYAWFSLGG